MRNTNQSAAKIRKSILSLLLAASLSVSALQPAFASQEMSATCQATSVTATAAGGVGAAAGASIVSTGLAWAGLCTATMGVGCILAIGTGLVLGSAAGAKVGQNVGQSFCDSKK